MNRHDFKQAFEPVSLSDKEKEVLLSSILAATDALPGERKQTMKHWSKKTLLVAAVLTAMFLLMGCAVIHFLVQDMQIASYEEKAPAWIDTDGAFHESKEYTQTVLSLQGIQDSIGYQAASEWNDFVRQYDPDKAVLAASKDFEAPEAYQGYLGLYSQEMVDKVTEIADKYGLKLSGRRGIVYERDYKLGWDALGIESPLKAGTAVTYIDRGCDFTESGNFSLWIRAKVEDSTFTYPRPLNIVMRYYDKAVFTTNLLKLTSLDNSRQWNYTCNDGTEVLILIARDEVYGNDMAYLFCDREDAFILIQPEFLWHEEDGSILEMSEGDLQWIAEHVDFHIQPRKPNMDEVLEAIRLEDEEYEAMLDSDDPFRQESYTKLRKVLGSVTQFSLIDLDGDGVEECFFFDADGNPQLYTMVQGKTEPLNIAGDVALCEGNVVKTTETVGKAYEIDTFYQLKDGAFTALERLVFDKANQNWSRSWDGVQQQQVLSGEEAACILASFPEIQLERSDISEWEDSK